jgi:hypothetical protein
MSTTVGCSHGRVRERSDLLSDGRCNRIRPGRGSFERQPDLSLHLGKSLRQRTLWVLVRGMPTLPVDHMGSLAHYRPASTASCISNEEYALVAVLGQVTRGATTIMLDGA